MSQVSPQYCDGLEQRIKELSSELSAEREKVKELESHNTLLAARLDEAPHAASVAYGYEFDALREQLAAAQATIAEMRVALRDWTEFAKDVIPGCAAGADWLDMLRNRSARLAIPTHQDALHEALARECERLASICDEVAGEYGTDTEGWYAARECAQRLREEAAAHCRNNIEEEQA